MANASLPVLARIVVSTCGSKIDETTPTVCQVSFWFLRTCPFILLIIGTTGNVLNLIVLSRPQMLKLPSAIFLLCLACSDSVVLWYGSIRSTLVHGWERDIRDTSVFACVTQEFLTFTCGVYSIWVMAAISVERMLRTKFPVTARSKITRQNVLIVCIVLFILCTLLSLHLPFGKTIQNVEEESHDNETEVKYVSKCTYVSKDYLQFYGTDWSMIQLFVVSIVPCMFLLICNAVTIWVIVRQTRRTQPSGNNPNTNNMTGRDERSKAVTRMVMIISLYYLITSAMFNIFITYVGGLPDDTSNDAVPNLAFGYIALFNIAISNYAFNFFFYFGSGPMFRRELIAVKNKVVRGVRRLFGVTVEETTVTIETVATVSK